MRTASPADRISHDHHQLSDRGAVRAQFPALAIKDGGRPRVYFDNPAGTQVPQQVIDRTLEALIGKNANLGGYFATTIGGRRPRRRGSSGDGRFLQCRDRRARSSSART